MTESNTQQATGETLDDIMKEAEREEAAQAQAEAEPETPEEAAQAEEADSMSDAGYQQGAKMAVGFVSQLVAMTWQGVQVPQDGQAAIAEKLAPVMRKHGGDIPAWMVPYREEIELMAAVAGVGFGVAMQIRAVKMMQAQQTAEQQEQEQQKESGPMSFADPVGGFDQGGK